MSYYMGDFYFARGGVMPGGRPVGDPGFFSFLGKIAKPLVGLIPGVGPIASTALSAIGGGAARSAAKVGETTAVAGMRGAASSAMKKAGSMIIKHPVLSAAGAAGAVAGISGIAGAEIEKHFGGACPKGHHISKHGHRAGSCVRNRHMNVCNPRALRRAIRRTHGFAKLAMKTIHLVHPKKKATFGGFKRRKKR